jgi:PIN domain nuclease of toxin-antitoxin system
MRVLLDTHLAIWWLAGDARLPAAARALVEDPATRSYVSLVSLWEMAVKRSLGKLRVDLAAFSAQLDATGFRRLGITGQHVLHVAQLPDERDHRDPFDRLLVAQSATEPMILLTADRRLERYGTTIRIV